MKNRSRSFAAGFTLVELLIVVAIISILAMLAIPNFQDATTRAKVANVKAGMAVLATAIETYAVDHSKYPVRHHRWEQDPLTSQDPCAYMMHHAPFSEKVYDPDPGEEKAAVGLHVITTPIAYLTILPTDLFNLPAKHTMTDTVYWSYG